MFAYFYTIIVHFDIVVKYFLHCGLNVLYIICSILCFRRIILLFGVLCSLFMYLVRNNYLFVASDVVWFLLYIYTLITECPESWDVLTNGANVDTSLLSYTAYIARSIR